MDFEGNRLRIIDSIKEAKRQNASLRVGPELEVTYVIEMDLNVASVSVNKLKFKLHEG